MAQCDRHQDSNTACHNGTDTKTVTQRVTMGQTQDRMSEHSADVLTDTKTVTQRVTMGQTQDRMS